MEVLCAASFDSFGLATLAGASLVGLGLTSIGLLLKRPFAVLCTSSSDALGDSTSEEGALSIFFDVLVGSAFGALGSRTDVLPGGGMVDDQSFAGRVMA